MDYHWSEEDGAWPGRYWFGEDESVVSSTVSFETSDDDVGSGVAVIPWTTPPPTGNPNGDDEAVMGSPLAAFMVPEPEASPAALPGRAVLEPEAPTGANDDSGPRVPEWFDDMLNEFCPPDGKPAFIGPMTLEMAVMIDGAVDHVRVE